MSFRGTEKEYQAQLDIVLDAPLVARWQMIDTKQSVLADEGLIEKFSQTIKPFITRESANIDDTMGRELKWFYPWDAVRETVLNALAHRDWTKSVDIEVTNYADRIEIISPGKFRNGMTIEKMIAGHRSYRNETILEVLRDCKYVDARGMGVRTKVIPSMRAANHRDPIFEATEDYVKTILPRCKEDIG
jgi:ATP-dependent DNA helicase RecG